MKLKHTISFIFCFFILPAAADPQTPLKVEIRKAGDGYQLFRDGLPYEVRGAGTQLPQDLESLVRHGGNSVRNWSTENAPEFLDRAHELGLTVALCLDIKRERHGFDYDDEAAVRRQFEFAREEVLRYRDHPALLVWIVGNELNLEYTNSRVYDAVNDIARMIHDLDPNHPVTTTTAGLDRKLARTIAERAPDIDFLSVQLYGGLFGFRDALKKIRWRKPLMITEWGTIGHWEVDALPWGAPLELNSHQKALTYRRGYEEVLEKLGPGLIGDFVFLWSHKQERTPTWYGMFLPGGQRTEVVDEMQRLWTREYPQNRAPVLKALEIGGHDAAHGLRLEAEQRYLATVEVMDPEGDKLAYEWRLMRESDATEVGGDAEVIPEDLSRLLLTEGGPETALRSPARPGPYRLYVYSYDGQGGAAHANIPFYVDPSKDLR
jgi:hypothetical protein